MRSRPFVSFLAAAAITGVTLAQAPPAYRESIPGTLVSFEMVLVPGDDAFYIGRTEVTWDMYDAFALRLDARTGGQGADAVARPSQPYGAPDYGWGHAGYPAISVTRAAAEAFCAWLSSKTGRVYRLPTDAEWERAAAAAAGSGGLTAARLDALAWHRGNAFARTHPVGQREADALGLVDLFGNAAEWVTTSDGALVTRGGSFRDEPAAVGPHARAVQDESWNERDPQLPKSRWWLSDGPFVGFRVVSEPSGRPDLPDLSDLSELSELQDLHNLQDLQEPSTGTPRRKGAEKPGNMIRRSLDISASSRLCVTVADPADPAHPANSAHPADPACPSDPARAEKGMSSADRLLAPSIERRL